MENVKNFTKYFRKYCKCPASLRVAGGSQRWGLDSNRAGTVCPVTTTRDRSKDHDVLFFCLEIYDVLFFSLRSLLLS